MDQTAFQAVSKLEQKLEQNRKQRQKLKHELGKTRLLAKQQTNSAKYEINFQVLADRA